MYRSQTRLFYINLMKGGCLVQLSTFGFWTLSQVLNIWHSWKPMTDHTDTFHSSPVVKLKQLHSFRSLLITNLTFRSCYSKHSILRLVGYVSKSKNFNMKHFFFSFFYPNEILKLCKIIFWSSRIFLIEVGHHRKIQREERVCII